MQLNQKWDRLLRRSPDRVVLTDAAGRHWTARSLDGLAQTWSKRLQDVPPKAGRIIGYSLPNGPDWIGLFIAILRTGGVAMPVDPGTGREAATNLVKTLGGMAYLDESDLQFWPVRGPRLSSTICLAKITSGSTGDPDRFCFTHDQMDADGRQIQSGMGIRSDDVNYALTPFGHSYGLGNFIMPLLRSGIRVVLGSSILPRVIFADLAANQATVFPAVPTLIRALAMADLPADRLGRIRLIISAGGHLTGETARRFSERFQLSVHGFYGSTETGGISYDRLGKDTELERSVGTPLPGIEISTSTTGRLLVKSSAAYSHANRRRTADGCGRVLLPDFGRVTKDGAVVLTGRNRGFVKKAGRRIGLGEIERVARGITGIRHAWATAIKVAGAGESMALAVETDLAPGAVRSALGECLQNWKRPSRIQCMKTFPVTARGKVATAELQRLLSQGHPNQL